MYGPARLVIDLQELGYPAEETQVPDGTRFVIIHRYEVPCGRFTGRVIDLGILATADFPRSVASAIHVRANPQLFDYGDTQPNVRNITGSVLGAEWRYWSHNFGWQGEKSARRLMSQVNGIFANA
jgi:E2/UBC family protein E